MMTAGEERVGQIRDALLDRIRDHPLRPISVARRPRTCVKGSPPTARPDAARCTGDDRDLIFQTHGALLSE
jgi:hypothetical protein